MRAFVTGVTGFVGSRLRDRLRAASWDVGGSDRELDVADADAVRDRFAAERPDAVVHLAAQSSVADSRKDPRGCFRTNVIGTRSVLSAVAAEAPKARVLFVGSGDCYGPALPGAAPYRESDSLSPGSPYAITKWAAEQWALRACAEGLDVVCVRPFNHTGAGQSDRFVASSFARQVSALAAASQDGVARETLHVGNLDAVRDFLHVDDVLDAYVALLEPRVPAAIYNVSSGEACEIRSLLDRLLELAQLSARIEVAPERWRPADSLVGDSTRLCEQTGWAPTRGIDTALAELLGYWRDTAPPPASVN